MRAAAADLEFEDAARMRDEIKRLEAMDLDMPVTTAPIDPEIAAKLVEERALSTPNKAKGKSATGRRGRFRGRRSRR
jgi:excinuclease ABC subunit B